MVILYLKCCTFFSTDKSNDPIIAKPIPTNSILPNFSPKKVIARNMVNTGCKAPAMAVTFDAFPSELYAAKLANTPKPFNMPANEPTQNVCELKLKSINPKTINPIEINTEEKIKLKYDHSVDIQPHSFLKIVFHKLLFYKLPHTMVVHDFGITISFFYSIIDF